MSLMALDSVAQSPSIFSYDQKTLRFIALSGAVIIYALTGSPSPDHPGSAEIITGFLLGLAVGPSTFLKAFLLKKDDSAWIAGGKIFLFYGFAVALPVAALNGNDAGLAFRDIIPFLFLFLPLFCTDMFEERPEYATFLLAIYAAHGFFFALRGLGEASLFNPFLQEDTKELYYFANSPAVLFAAVYLPGMALWRFANRPSFESATMLFLAGLIALIPILAMAVTLQRASLGWVFFSYSCYFLLAFWRFPVRSLFLIVLTIPVLFLFEHQITHLLGHLAHKTEIYGVNKRGMEMEAVWQEIRGNIGNTFFGLGWGGTFNSPAVGGVRVNFTHNSFSGALLKTGLCGAGLTVFYFSGFFRKLFTILRCDLILGLALAGPLLIDVFLYASYKWLDFGLLLLTVQGVWLRILHRLCAYCMQEA